MRTVVIPAAGADWELRQTPRPSPGPGEVLIRVRASAICHNDVLAGLGILPFPSTSPAIPGHEPAGDVVEVGAGVTSRQVGDRVGVTWIQGVCGRCAQCRRDSRLSGRAAFSCAAPATTGFTAPGGQAEWLLAPAAGTVLLPADLSYELAAPMLCSGYTAWSALSVGAPRPGERVAVLGIGGIGHLAVQFAAAAGFETVAITRSSDKHAIAADLGATLVLGSGTELDAAGGADVILATAPSYSSAGEAMRGLRPGGRMVLAGIDGREPFSIPPDLARPFFAHGQQILGATHGGMEHLALALASAAAGEVTPRIEVFAPEQIAQAAAAVATGSVRFRAVVAY
ncbi:MULTISPECIES: alcohol dehydrogenase catalytic domain-containing protein [Actinoalloteichus]|uniref:alcohol dehydrogenase n=1 Tax=Actinoalloteichus fjordicus TaxID=1612552 RepID=A0AAC9LDW3_9PSEU|nr:MULTISPECIES: alcohol dehydrogenase catalytic domain-containing protein [Actinoalloteichus]APU15551.1 Zn-dependent alcohol dehydrogenase [Actinoalloteichus fjordicus]APU21618.1 Zn-dependent alcohol dehydrogenase [Actinoalloteichus sp. GBA129-24]